MFDGQPPWQYLQGDWFCDRELDQLPGCGLPPGPPGRWQRMQLVAGPLSWQAAQDSMSRRAARPWKLRELVSLPSQPIGCGLDAPGRAALTPRRTWHVLQLEGAWQLVQVPGRELASIAC